MYNYEDNYKDKDEGKDKLIPDKNNSVNDFLNHCKSFLESLSFKHEVYRG